MAAENGMKAGGVLRQRGRFRWVRWLVWSALLLAVAAAISARICLSPEHLRAAVQSRLATMVEGKVRVAEAEFAMSRGIVLRGITIEDTLARTKRPVVQIESLTLIPKWGSLPSGSPILKSVSVEGAQVSVELDAAGSWPFLQRIHLPVRRGAPMPRIEVRGTRVQVATDTPDKAAHELQFSEVMATVQPSGTGGWSAEVCAKEAALGDLRANLQRNGTDAAVHGSISISSPKVYAGPNLREFLPSSITAELLDLYGLPPGSFALDAKLTWDERAQPPFHVAGTIDVRDVSAKFRSLPYPITGLNATVAFADREFRIVGAHAKAGEIALAGSGTMSIAPGGEVSCDLDATAKGVRAERAIHEKLPADAQRVWDWINPTQGPAGGSLDVAIRILRRPGAGTTVSGNVELVGFACAPRRAPVALTNIAGRVTFTPDDARTQGITGKAGDAPFSIVSGAVSFEKDGAFELDGAVKGFKLDGAFKDMVPPEASARIPESVLKHLEEAKVSGQVDSSFKVTRAKGAQDIRPDIAVTLEDLTFSHPKLGRPITLNARGRYTGDTLTISQASASWGPARLEMPAMTINLAEGAPKSFSAHVSNLEMDRQVRDLLPAGTAKTWDEYGVGGTADIDFHMERGEAADATAHTRAVVSLRDGRMTYADFPYPVREVFGRLEIVDGLVDRAEFSGRNGPTLIGLTSVPNVYDGAPGRLVIIRAMDGPLDQDVRNALPQRSRELWDALKPTGKINLNVTVQHFWNKTVGAERAFFTMIATLPEFSLQAAVPTQTTMGYIKIEEANEEEAGKFAIKGRFNFSEASFERVALEGFRGTFLSGGGVLRLENLAGTCYGGNIVGALSLYQTASPPAQAGTPDGQQAAAPADELQGNFSVAGADVRGITEGTEIKNLSGRLDATSRFSGSLTDSQTFRAKGTMTIRDGEIGELPGVFAGWNLLQLRGLHAGAFQSLDLKYRVEGGALTADEINLGGNILSLHGEGKLGADGKLNFTFLPKLGPKWIPRIPGVDDLIDLVKRAVIPVTVGGNANDPVWQLNPALSLTRTIQKLMGEMIHFNIAKPKPVSDSVGKTEAGPAR